jgi:hypothetical protein
VVVVDKSCKTVVGCLVAKEKLGAGGQFHWVLGADDGLLTLYQTSCGSECRRDDGMTPRKSDDQLTEIDLLIR